MRVNSDRWREGLRGSTVWAPRQPAREESAVLSSHDARTAPSDGAGCVPVPQADALVSLGAARAELRETAAALWLKYVRGARLLSEEHAALLKAKATKGGRRKAAAATKGAAAPKSVRGREGGEKDGASDEEESEESDTEESEEDLALAETNVPRLTQIDEDDGLGAAVKPKGKGKGKGKGTATVAKVAATGASKAKPERKYDVSETMPAYLTLVSCYAAMVWLREPVVPGDLVDLVVAGRLPYKDFHGRLPGEQELTADGRIVHEHTFVERVWPPAASRVHDLAHELAEVSGAPFPPANMPALCARLSAELGFPTDVAEAAFTLLDMLALPSTTLGERPQLAPDLEDVAGPMPHELAAAVVVIAARLLSQMDSPNEPEAWPEAVHAEGCPLATRGQAHAGRWSWLLWSHEVQLRAVRKIERLSDAPISNLTDAELAGHFNTCRTAIFDRHFIAGAAVTPSYKDPKREADKRLASASDTLQKIANAARMEAAQKATARTAAASEATAATGDASAPTAKRVRLETPPIFPLCRCATYVTACYNPLSTGIFDRKWYAAAQAKAPMAMTLSAEEYVTSMSQLHCADSMALLAAVCAHCSLAQKRFVKVLERMESQLGMLEHSLQQWNTLSAVWPTQQSGEGGGGRLPDEAAVMDTDDADGRNTDSDTVVLEAPALPTETAPLAAAHAPAPAQSPSPAQQKTLSSGLDEIEQALVHALEYSFEDSMSFGDLAKELGDVANKRQLREACNRLVAAKLLERAPGPGEQYAIALR